MKFEVKWTQTLEREVTALVEAESREEAIEKAKKGEVEYSDEDCAPDEVAGEDGFSAHEVEGEEE